MCLGGPSERGSALSAAAYVSLLICAFMSLFFESPYLSPPYWVALALMHLCTTSLLQASPQPLTLALVR